MVNVKASKIAKFLNSELLGQDMLINNAASIDNAIKSSLAFSKNNDLSLDIECLIIVKNNYFKDKYCKYSIIRVDNPRLSFARVVNKFFVTKKRKEIHVTATIGTNCDILSSVSIGANCVIGDNVTIGSNTIINNNVVIFDNTSIGSNCYIKSGSVIGEDGFGFAFEEGVVPVRIPHVGRVSIGDNVEIGAKNTIARGTLDDTTICNNVKTDDQVHIAHNCYIGKNTIITACSEISGSVVIGENCWIAPNSAIKQKVKIGDRVVLGINSTIVNNIESDKKIMGLEGLELRSLLKVKKRIEYGK